MFAKCNRATCAPPQRFATRSATRTSSSLPSPQQHRHKLRGRGSEPEESGQIFLDINSVSPATKRENARLIEPSGAQYVEAAVMAPVPPRRLAVPMLLGGPHAVPVAQALSALGMSTTAVAGELGVASAIKMCRSIVIKGLEALTVECVMAAREFEAAEQVFASLDRTFPHMRWTSDLPDYLVGRVAEHGRRRAAEMHEVERTLASVG